MTYKSPHGLSMDDLDELVGNEPLGKSLTNSIYGLNNGLIKPALPIPSINKHNLFFVRPQLNLRSYNIASNRLFGQLLTPKHDGIETALRLTLDPRMEYEYKTPTKLSDPIMDRSFKEKITSNLVNNRLAFIPILSNSLVSFDGWIDLTMGEYQTTPNMHKNSVSMIDDIDEINTPTAFSATFRTIATDYNRMLLYMMYRWQSQVYRGIVARYPDFELANVKDYNTRVFDILTAGDGTSIVEWASTGPATVNNINFSSKFNFTEHTTHYDENKQFTAEFKASNIRYNEVIDLVEFNMAQSYFHPGMKDGVSIKANMVIPKDEEKYLFKNRAYPLVDIKRMQLLWLVDKDYYEAKIRTLKRNGLYKVFVTGENNSLPEINQPNV